LEALDPEITKKNTFPAQVVSTTGSGARAPWLQQHSISTFFGTPRSMLFIAFYTGMTCSMLSSKRAITVV